MITIASLLDNETNSLIEKIWTILDHNCELSGISNVPFPHFSWFTAMSNDGSTPRFKMEQLSRQIEPFYVETSGLGIFTLEAPILYLPLIKTKNLLTIHERIWSSMVGSVIGISKHYSPDQWMPHITLAYGDVTSDKLTCAIQSLVLYDLNHRIHVDNIALLSRSEYEAKIECVYHFQ